MRLRKNYSRFLFGTALLLTAPVVGTAQGAEAEPVRTDVGNLSDGGQARSGGLPDYAPLLLPDWGDRVVVNNINSADLPTELFGDQNSFLKYAYRNFGTGSGSADFQFESRIDDTIVFAPTFPNGPVPGNGSSWSHEPYISGGRHTAWLLLDPNDLEPESNETNNGYARQWVWEPQPLADDSSARRAQPPERFAGAEYIPGGVDFYPNMDGMRIEFTTEAWVAAAISSLNGSDYDAYLFDSSTGVEDGFETPIGESRIGGGTTDFVIVNQLSWGAQAYDIGLERYSGDGEFIVDYRDINGFGYPSGGGGPRAVSEDQIIDMQPLVVGSGDVGRHVVQVENVSTSQPLELLLFRPDLLIGGRSDATATAAVVDGSAFIDFDATEGNWCYVLVREASEGTGPFTYEVRFRPTPPDLATAVLPGSHGPVVPQPDGTIGAGNPVPAPTILNGDENTTVFYYHLANEGPADADPWEFDIVVDGFVPFPDIDGPFPLPGGTSDIFSQANGPFFVRGGRHTAGIVYDSSDLYDELDEDNNRHAEQWVWEPTQLALGETLTRSGPPDPTGGWEDIPTGLPRELNADGLRTPVYVGNNQTYDGYWGGFAVTPFTGDVGLRVHALSTGAEDGFSIVEEAVDLVGNFIELVLFDLDDALPTGAYDIGITGSAPNSHYAAHATESEFLPPDNSSPIGQSYPGLTLGAGELLAIYEFGTLDGTGLPVPIKITVENQSGNADLVLAVLGRTDPSGYYSVAFESLAISDDPTDGASESVELELDPDVFYGVVVFKSNGDETGKNAEFTLHFTDPATTGVEPVARFETSIASYPEPFGNQTDVHFSLASAGRASIQIFDVNGRLVRTLADGEFAAGSHSMAWEGRDDRGRELANGVYLARFQHDGGSEMRRMIRIR